MKTLTVQFLLPGTRRVPAAITGKFAAFRELLRSVPFLTGYGVELGLLVDVLEGRACPQWPKSIWAPARGGHRHRAAAR
jgi:hypothetical protein